MPFAYGKMMKVAALFYRVEAVDLAFFRDRGFRGASPQPLQNAPEIGSGEGNYTTHDEFEAKTHQGNIPRLGAHLDPPKIIRILGELRHCILCPPGGGGAGEQLVRRPRALHLAPGGELKNRQGPFHERDNPLPVEVRDDGRCHQPLPRQMCQRVGQALELG